MYKKYLPNGKSCTLIQQGRCSMKQVTKEKPPATITCHNCGQIIMFDACTSIPLADGPDDFVEVAMCQICADEYEMMFRDEPEYEEEVSDEGQQTKEDDGQSEHGEQRQLELE